MKIEARCMKCKLQVEIGEPKAVQLKNGMWAVKGKHIICNTNVSKIVGKQKPENLEE